MGEGPVDKGVQGAGCMFCGMKIKGLTVPYWLRGVICIVKYENHQLFRFSKDLTLGKGVKSECRTSWKLYL